MISPAIWLEILESTLRVSAPLVFAALAGLMSERSGVVNIALEGLMLIGALAAAIVTLATHDPLLGVLGAMVGGALMASVYGLAVITLRADQIVSGTAINMLAMGAAPFICKLLYDATGSTPAIPIDERLGVAPIWIALLTVVGVYYWYSATPSGLRTRFAGEHPRALAAAGIGVLKTRWAAVCWSGALAGIGGAMLSIYLSSSYSRNMTAGRGFMALAALIFGKWKPVPAVLACLLFGFFEAIQIRLQGVVLWGTEPVPVQFIQILPYIVTVLVLAGFVGRSRAPRSLGLPYRQA